MPREQNKEADALTRVFDKDDWKLNPRLFQMAQDLWGPHDIDRFAGQNNNLLPVFNSLRHCPGSAGVNALNQTNWGNRNNWCNPPFPLIPDLLAVLKEQVAEATVVVPIWPSRPWWPSLLARGDLFAPFVVGCKQLSQRGYVLARPPMWRGWAPPSGG